MSNTNTVEKCSYKTEKELQFSMKEEKKNRSKTPSDHRSSAVDYHYISTHFIMSKGKYNRPSGFGLL